MYIFMFGTYIYICTHIFIYIYISIYMVALVARIASLLMLYVLMNTCSCISKQFHRTSHFGSWEPTTTNQAYLLRLCWEGHRAQWFPNCAKLWFCVAKPKKIDNTVVFSYWNQLFEGSKPKQQLSDLLRSFPASDPH